MDDALKQELIRTGIPAVAVPVLRASVSHHFATKRMEQKKEMEVEVAERKQQGMREMARVHGASVGPASGVRQEPVGGTDGDVYDELTALRGETDCEFCRDVIGPLMDAPPGEARQGLDELRSYVRETERIENRDITQSEAEEIVGDLVDRWEVVPQYAVSI